MAGTTGVHAAETPQGRFGSLTAAQVSVLDAAAVASGVSLTQLMEVAGFQVARCAWWWIGQRPARIHVVAGRGNNGGDGLVAARHLSSWGCAVSAAVLAGRLDAQLEVLVAAATASGVTVTVADTADVLAARGEPDLTVDGLLGTGLRLPVRAPEAAMISALRGPVLAVDVPSGLDATTGDHGPAVVRAALTCTLTACKQAFWLPETRSLTGQLVVADIGMPAAAFTASGVRRPTAVRGGTLVDVARETPLP